MLSSKEICDTFNLTHYGREIKLISFTSLDQVKENSIIFLKNVSSKKLIKLKEHKSSFVIFPTSAKDSFIIDDSCSYVFHDDPRTIFFEIIEKYFSNHLDPGIDSSAYIDKKAVIGSNVYIGKNVIIDSNSIIGDNVFIGACSQIIGLCDIGKNTSISSGVIIGEESLSIRNENNINYQNSQKGGVIIGKNSRIGVFSTISRGSIGDTILGENVFMGEYAHVGHNSEISDKSVMTIRSSVCGSVLIEKPCWLGPHSLILNGVTIKEEIKLGAGSVLQTNAKKSGTYFGNPAKLLEFNRKTAKI